jgi:Fur family peroxide stress response transcriptional regulator
MLTGQELSDLLRHNGYKVTPQRLAVYAALAERPWHPNAETLYAQLQPEYPAMSLATVYKAVEILHAINAIQILNTGEDCYRYDANVEEHYHLRCLRCGRIDDAVMDEQARDSLTAMVEGDSGYAISGRQFYFYGLCPQCHKAH